MNTRHCLYMLTIANTGYLSRAAQKLGVTQAALSKFLNEQERLMGTALFLRNKKHLYPTPAGQIYLEVAQQILSVKNHTLQAIGAVANVRPLIRLASTPYRGAEIFSRIYSRFSAHFPDTELKLEEVFSAQQEELIHSGKIDFACGSSCHTSYSDVTNVPISREELVLALPHFHPLAKYAGPDIEHLSFMPLRVFHDVPFVLPSRKSNIRLIADKLFAAAGFEPVIAFESGNNMVVDSMLRQGIGVGFLSHRYVKPDSGMVYFRLDPPCYETTYIRYATGHIFTEEEKYLCGLIIRERLHLFYNELIPGADVNSFLNCLMGDDKL